MAFGKWITIILSPNSLSSEMRKTAFQKASGPTQKLVFHSAIFLNIFFNDEILRHFIFHGPQNMKTILIIQTSLTTVKFLEESSNSLHHMVRSTPAGDSWLQSTHWRLFCSPIITIKNITLLVYGLNYVPPKIHILKS